MLNLMGFRILFKIDHFFSAKAHVRFGSKADMCSAPTQVRERMFVAACDLGIDGIVSKKLNTPYRSGPA